MTPDVSIIIPAYNAAATIGGLLASILRETRVALGMKILFQVIFSNQWLNCCAYS